jgi:dolichol-phosphate mannosyltransferase
MTDAEQTPGQAPGSAGSSFLARFPVGLRQFVKFGLVGGTGTLVNLGVFSLLIFIWHRAASSDPGVFKQLASGIAFCVAVLSNFLLNRQWTFRHTGRIIPNFGRFFIVSLVGLGLNELSFTLLNSVGHVEVHVSQLLAILIVTPVNFVGSKWWAFR